MQLLSLERKRVVPYVARQLQIPSSVCHAHLQSALAREHVSVHHLRMTYEMLLWVHGVPALDVRDLSC